MAAQLPLLPNRLRLPSHPRTRQRRRANQTPGQWCLAGTREQVSAAQGDSQVNVWDKLGLAGSTCPFLQLSSRVHPAAPDRKLSWMGGPVSYRETAGRARTWVRDKEHTSREDG